MGEAASELAEAVSISAPLGSVDTEEMGADGAHGTDGVMPLGSGVPGETAPLPFLPRLDDEERTAPRDSDLNAEAVVVVEVAAAIIVVVASESTERVVAVKSSPRFGDGSSSPGARGELDKEAPPPLPLPPPPPPPADAGVASRKEAWSVED